MPVDGERNWAELIGAVYDGALSPPARDVALRRIAVEYNAAAAQLYAVDNRTREVLYQAEHDLPARYAREYKEHYSALSERNNFVIGHPGDDIFYDDLIGDQQADGGGEICEWRRSFGFHYFIAGRLLDDGAVTAILALHRTRARGHVNGGEIDCFRTLLPHLRRAFLIENRLEGLNLQLESAWSSMDMLRFGVALIGIDRRVLWMNREARRIVQDGAGLRVTPTGLQAMRPIDRPKLTRLIDDAVETGLGRRHAGGGYLPVAKLASARPYSLLAAPVPNPPTFLAAEQPAAILFVTDPDSKPETPPELLRRVYGLSRTEANVAIALVGGATLESAATQLGIARATARRHLAAIFTKTETHRQADLIRLILAAPPPPLH